MQDPAGSLSDAKLSCQQANTACSRCRISSVNINGGKCQRGGHESRQLVAAQKHEEELRARNGDGYGRV